MNELELKPEQKKIITQAEKITKDLSDFTIRNQEEYDRAGEYRKNIKIAYKEIEELRFSFTRPLDALKVKWTEFFAVSLSKLKAADTVCERERLIFFKEQERIRLEQEEKLRKAAEAEEAKKRKIKEDQERAWREKEEAARKEADRLEKAGKAEEAEKARAEQAKAAKLAEERRIQAEEVRVVAPVLAPTVEKTAGISGRKNWKFEIIDEALIPRKYLQPNLVQIGKEVRAAGENLSIPGVKIYPDEKEVVRTR